MSSNSQFDSGVTMEELRRAGEYALLDMRPAGAREYGMIPGALPYERNYAAGITAKGVKAVLYCHRGDKSKAEAESLIKEGVKAYYLKGGYMRWLQDAMSAADDGEICDMLKKILAKEASDRAGLIYGMGHAVYTLSDPRAVILKKTAFEMAKGTEYEAQFELLNSIERLSPIVFKEVTGNEKALCANVDMYSGLCYRMLKIPEELATALFAVSRLAGWCAHRFEEKMTCSRIIRPAYKAIRGQREYVDLADRT